MMSPAQALVGSVVLTFVMLLVGSLARTGGYAWSGLPIAFGNRDRLPEASAFAGRAERAARNMVENLVLFATLVLAASIADVPSERLAFGATVFFAARVVYAPLYWAGVAYLRTVAWAVSLVGLAAIASAAVG